MDYPLLIIKSGKNWQVSEANHLPDWPNHGKVCVKSGNWTTYLDRKTAFDIVKKPNAGEFFAMVVSQSIKHMSNERISLMHFKAWDEGTRKGWNPENKEICEVLHNESWRRLTPAEREAEEYDD